MKVSFFNLTLCGDFQREHLPRNCKFGQNGQNHRGTNSFDSSEPALSYATKISAIHRQKRSYHPGT